MLKFLENQFKYHKIKSYELISNILQAHQSNRVCNALALLQCIASHQETRSPFLQGFLFVTVSICLNLYHIFIFGHLLDKTFLYESVCPLQ